MKRLLFVMAIVAALLMPSFAEDEAIKCDIVKCFCDGNKVGEMKTSELKEIAEYRQYADAEKNNRLLLKIFTEEPDAIYLIWYSPDMKPLKWVRFKQMAPTNNTTPKLVY